MSSGIINFCLLKLTTNLVEAKTRIFKKSLYSVMKSDHTTEHVARKFNVFLKGS